MSILSKIANVVGVEFDDVPSKNIQVHDVATKPTATKAEVKPTVVVAEPVVPAPTVLTDNDAEYVKVLETALKDASNGSASNFYKFKASVDSLVSIITDEMTRFKTAWATLSATSDMTIDSLLTSADEFLVILGNENKNFEEGLATAYTAKVTSRQGELDKIASSKNEILEKITKLTEDMNALTEQELTVKNEIEASKSSLEIKKNNFASAFYKVNAKLSNAKANVEKYLKEVK